MYKTHGAGTAPVSLWSHLLRYRTQNSAPFQHLVCSDEVPFRTFLRNTSFARYIKNAILNLKRNGYNATNWNSTPFFVKSFVLSFSSSAPKFHVWLPFMRAFVACNLVLCFIVLPQPWIVFLSNRHEALCWHFDRLTQCPLNVRFWNERCSVFTVPFPSYNVLQILETYSRGIRNILWKSGHMLLMLARWGHWN